MLELQAAAGIDTHLDGPHSRVPVGKLTIETRNVAVNEDCHALLALQTHGCRILAARNGKDAMGLADSHGGTRDRLVTGAARVERRRRPAPVAPDAI